MRFCRTCTDDILWELPFKQDMSNMKLHGKGAIRLVIVLMVFATASSTMVRELVLMGFQKTNWNNAQQLCEADGGNLVTMDSPDVLVAMQIFGDEKWKDSFTDFWTGLHLYDETKPGDYLWADCQPLGAHDWAPWRDQGSWDKDRCIQGKDSLEINSNWDTKRCDGHDGKPVCEKYTDVSICPFQRVANKYVDWKKSGAITRVYVNATSLPGCFTECRGYSPGCRAVALGAGGCHLYLSEHLQTIYNNLEDSSDSEVHIQLCFTDHLVTKPFTEMYETIREPKSGCTAPVTTTTKLSTTVEISTKPYQYKSTNSSSQGATYSELVRATNTTTIHPGISTNKLTTSDIPSFTQKPKTGYLTSTYKPSTEDFTGAPQQATSQYLTSTRKPTTDHFTEVTHQATAQYLTSTSTPSTDYFTEVTHQETGHFSGVTQQTTSQYLKSTPKPTTGHFSGVTQQTTSQYLTSTDEDTTDNLSEATQQTTTLYETPAYIQTMHALFRVTQQTKRQYTIPTDQQTVSEQTVTAGEDPTSVERTSQHQTTGRDVLTTTVQTAPMDTLTLGDKVTTARRTTDQSFPRDQTTSYPQTNGRDQTQTTSDIDTSPDTHNQEGDCECRCRIHVYPNLTWVEKEAFLAAIISNLTIDTSTVSAARRKRECASDPRPSAQTVGGLGVALLTLIFGGLFVLDIEAILRDLTHIWNTLRPRRRAGSVL